MGGATTSTPGTRSPRRLSFLWGSRNRESEVLLRRLMRIRLLLTRLSLGLSGRRRRRIRFTLIGYGISYKELLFSLQIEATCPSNRSFEVNDESRSFLFASSVNSLAPEADKSTITYTAYQSYTYSTKIDISTCLPEAFAYKYCIFEG